MSDKITLINLKDKTTGQTNVIRLDKKRVVIGSSSSCDVKIENENVSPVHAILEVSGQENKPVIYDLASDTGITVNGNKTVQSVVADNDVIGIAGFEIRLGSIPQAEVKIAPKLVMESFGRKLYVGEKEDLTPLILANPDNAIEIFDRKQESKQSLQVVMFYKNTILDVEHFVNKKRIVIGPGGRKDDFNIPPFFGEGKKGHFDLVTFDDGRYVLHLNSAMKGVVHKDGSLSTVETLLAGQSSKDLSLSFKDFAKVKLDDVSFFMNHTPAPPRLNPPKFRSSDPFFMKIWLLSLAMTSALIVTLSKIEVNPAIEIEQIPERVATIIYQPKDLPRESLPKVLADKEIKQEAKNKITKVTPVAPTEPAPKDAVIGEKKEEKKPIKGDQTSKNVKPGVAKKASGQEGKGAKAKGDEGTRGKQTAPKSDSSQTKAVRPNDGKPSKAASTGKGQSQTQDLGVVDVFKSSESTLSKVLSGGKGASSAANKLEGYSGFTTQGAGGLGAAGGAQGGGGESQGLGGLTDKGIGGGKKGSGLGALGTGGNILGGKGKITVESGGGAGEPIVFGAIDTAAIAREIEKHRDEIKYCYEKEINAENPNLSGRVGVRFVIGASGSVTTAGISSSTLRNANAEQCIVDVIKRIQFPPVKGGGVAEVTYPFVFKPSTK